MVEVSIAHDKVKERKSKVDIIKVIIEAMVDVWKRRE